MSPRYSVLLPTRNRLDLLKGAIASVVRQDYGDWEIIVADNLSTDDVVGYVQNLGDPRIKVIRSDRSLPVTDNWNRALDASTGAYVVMLGDDDALAPGYFREIDAALTALNAPDLIYHGAYHFAFPGVMPAMPEGALTDVTFYHGLLRACPRVSLLPAQQAAAAARAALNMRADYGFNMQYFLFSRPFIERQRKYGAFFQGPFPDFFAANLALLTADRIGRIAAPLVVIGISPKSYGFYHFNDKEKSGISFLGIEEHLAKAPSKLREQLLPGTNMNTSWLVSVAPIPTLLGREGELTVGIQRYRFLQIVQSLRAHATGRGDAPGLAEFWPLLSWRERFTAFVLTVVLAPARVLPASLGRRLTALVGLIERQYLPPPKKLPAPVVGRLRSMQDVFDHLERERARTEPARSGDGAIQAREHAA